MSPTNSGLMQIPSVISTETGELVERGRIKTAGDLNSVHQMFFNADLLASQKRSVYQAMVDGAAPYDTAREQMLGQAGRANINWLQLADTLEESVKPYSTLLESLDVFGTAPTTYGDAVSRRNWEPLMAQEIARTLKLWPSFHSSWDRNVRTLKMDGISFAFFDDNIDWRWKVQSMQNLKMPREVPADLELLDMITCETSMLPHELFRKLEGEKHLPEEERYWNREEGLKALKQAAPQGLDMSNWEAVEQAWKDNDLTYGMTSPVVRIVHGWVKELDGTVTHLIARYAAGTGTAGGEFLYKCEGKYRQMSQLLTEYTDGVGVNGDFHSIRGLGYKLFGAAAGQNKLRNKILDASCIAATPHLSSESEDSITDRSIQHMGPYQILDNKAQYAEMPDLNLAQNAFPALQMLDSIFTSKAAAQAPITTSPLARTAKTKYQVQSEEEQEGALTSGSFFNFMSSWGRHYRNVVRRLTNRDYQSTDPGGTEVMKLRARLVALGVPLEAFFNIDVDAIEINMGIGKGSIPERRSSLNAVYDLLYPSMDQEGRQEMNRAVATSYLGPAMGRRLFPDEQGLRPPVDAQVAQLENSIMSMGKPSAFEPNQDHVVHVDAHLTFLYQINTLFEEQRMELRDTIDQMQPVWEHCLNDHMPLVSDQDPDYGRFKEGLQQLGEFITNSRKHLDAEDARAAEEQAESELSGEPHNPGLFRSAVDASARADEADQLTIEKTRQEVEAARMEQIRKSQLHQAEMAKKKAEIAKTDVELALKVKNAAKPSPKAKA